MNELSCREWQIDSDGGAYGGWDSTSVDDCSTKIRGFCTYSVRSDGITIYRIRTLNEGDRRSDHRRLISKPTYRSTLLGFSDKFLTNPAQLTKKKVMVRDDEFPSFWKSFIEPYETTNSKAEVKLVREP